MRRLSGAMAKAQWSKMISSCQVMPDSQPEEEISEITTLYGKGRRERNSESIVESERALSQARKRGIEQIA